MIRRPGETANSKFTACCLVPFSMPFILMPLFFAYMIWFQNKEIQGDLGKIGITLFLSIFLAVGLGIFYAGISSTVRAYGYGAKPTDTESNRRSVRSPDSFEWFPKASPGRQSGSRGGVQIAAESTALGKSIFLGIFALVWLGFVGTILYFMVFGNKPAPTIALIIVGVMFLAGLGILWAAIHAMLTYFLTGETYLELANEPVMAGQSVAFAIIQKGSFSVQQVAAKFICRETARYTVGTNTTTKQEVVQSMELVAPQPASADPNRPVVEGRIQVPADAAPSFVTSNNRVEWGVEVTMEIDNRPDVKAFFPIRVISAEGGR